MKLAKFTPDEEGIFHLKGVTAAVWTGLQNHVPTMICVQAEEGETGRDLQFVVKKIGDTITGIELTKQLVISLVDNDGEYIILTDKPQMLEVAQPGQQLPPPPVGPSAPEWPLR